MRRVFLLLLGLIAIFPLFAVTHYFTGEVNEEKIWFVLDENSDVLLGSLRFDSSVAKLELKGSIKQNEYSFTTENDSVKIRFRFNYRTHKLKGECEISDNIHPVIWSEIGVSSIQERKTNRITTLATSPIFFDQELFTSGCVDILDKEIEKQISQIWAEALTYYLSDSEHFIGYSKVYNIEPVYYSKDLLSFTVNDYLYSGGAHGNYSWSGRTFISIGDDIKELTFEDISKNQEFSKTVSQYCLNELKTLGADYVVRKSRTGFTAEELKDFVVTAQGLQFFFPPYMLDCYAAGDFKVLVPWKEIKNYISNDSPLDRFVK